MSSEELLLMLVHEVFNDEESSNAIDKSVGLGWVEVDGVGVTSSVSN